jgi:hypothetical protein
MTRKSTLFAIIFACVLSIVALVQVTDAQGPRPGTRAPSANVGTAFTYQGQLKDNGAAVNGAYDFEFRLFDAVSGGTEIGSLISIGDANVTSGYFTVQLDFGTSAFNGDARFLEIRVRPGASVGAYTTLNPRQTITPAPMAFALPGLYTRPNNANPNTPNIIGGSPSNVVASSVGGGTIEATTTNGANLIPIAIAEVDSPPTSVASARLVTVNQINATQFVVYITNGSYTLVDNQFVFMVTGR